MNTSLLLFRILQMLARTETVELSCGEVDALLDEYAELQAAGGLKAVTGTPARGAELKDRPQLYELVEKHLRVCPECREDYEALLTMIFMDLQPQASLA